jgi:class 3 adenylate cyclase
MPWAIEIADGRTREIGAACSIGRAARNDLVLDGDEISRFHALIHRQGVGEYWLVDMGACNGTQLNGRPVVAPTRLSRGDILKLGKVKMLISAPGEETEDVIETLSASTVRRLQVTKQWLMLGDLIGFTQLSRSLQPEPLARLVGSWMAECRDLVEANGGGIHKYLGDGWFASWVADGSEKEGVISCIREIRKRQANADPKFRIAVHLGDVTCSGSPAGSELGMLGPDVNLLFRMEKLASSLSRDALVSKAAWSQLDGLLAGGTAGKHRVKGFDSEDEYFWLE